MAVLTLRHRIATTSGPAIEEDQTIVYLPIPDRYAPPKPVAAPETADFDETVTIDPVRLFRYSAVTFNGHRIHYDRSYATQVEHYPALVVHGPLQATLLIEAAARHAGRPPATFRYRGVHPMFDTHPLRLIGTMTEDNTMTLCTAAPEGHIGTQATAGWS
jgi:3-methylfumaryl-CoA hydratase